MRCFIKKLYTYSKNISRIMNHNFRDIFSEQIYIIMERHFLKAKDVFFKKNVQWIIER